MSPLITQTKGLFVCFGTKTFFFYCRKNKNDDATLEKKKSFLEVYMLWWKPTIYKINKHNNTKLQDVSVPKEVDFFIWQNEQSQESYRLTSAFVCFLLSWSILHGCLIEHVCFKDRVRLIKGWVSINSLSSAPQDPLCLHFHLLSARSITSPVWSKTLHHRLLCL